MRPWTFIAGGMLAFNSLVTASPTSGVNTTLVNALTLQVKALRASANPYLNNINKTLAGLGSNPTAAQQKSAVQAIRADYVALNTAMQVAIVAAGPISPVAASVTSRRDVEPEFADKALATRQLSPTGIAELIEFLIADLISAVTGPLKALQSGNFMDLLIALFAPVDYLIGYILLGELTDTGVLFSRPDYLAKLSQLEALLRQD